MRVSSLIERVEDRVRGRMLIFFLREYTGNIYRFTDAARATSPSKATQNRQSWPWSFASYDAAAVGHRQRGSLNGVYFSNQARTATWLEPVPVRQFELTEWTPAHHLRHRRLVGLRLDKECARRTPGHILIADETTASIIAFHCNVRRSSLWNIRPYPSGASYGGKIVNPTKVLGAFDRTARRS